MNDSDLKCLPTNFVGTSKPSKIIEALNEKRQKAEKKALDDMRASQQEICHKYEQVIEEMSQELKMQLHDIRGRIKDELFDIKEKASFEEDFKQVFKRVLEHTQKQHDLTDDFYLNLINVEKNKSKEFTDVLKKTYETIKRVAFKTPSEYDELIEFEIERTNQTLLCNDRNFLELKTQIQLEIQNYTKTALFDLQNVKERLQSQSQQELSDLREKFTNDINKVTEELTTKIVDFKGGLSEIDVTKKPQFWLNGIRQSLATLDRKAQKILKSYKEAAVLVYNRFFEDFQDIEQALVDLDNLEPVPKEQTETYTPPLPEIEKMYSDELENIQTLWDDLMEQLTKTLDNTHTFLANTSILWQRHFKRTKQLQAIMLKDMENTIKTHNIILEPIETKLNVLIDTLRQEASKERLRKTLEDIHKQFLIVDALYKGHYQAEINVLKKYKSTHEFKTDILIAEIKRFLILNPPDSEKDPKIQRKRGSQTSEITDPTEDKIPLQMVFCKFQIGAVANWQFGVWEAINNYMTVARTEIAAEAEKWFEQHVVHLGKRLTNRLALHKMRSEKVEAYVYEERLEELCLHQTRFEEHRGAVEGRLAALKDEYKSYQDVYNTIIKDYKNEMSQMKAACVDSRSSFGVAAMKPVIDRCTEKSLDEINSLVADYLDKWHKFSHGVKASHVVLLKQTKLFSEEGNFAVQEIKDLIKNMEKIEAQVDKTSDEIKKTAHLDKETMIQTIHTTNTEMHSSIKAVKKEHDFNEALIKKQQNLRKDLVEVVCAMQHKLKTLTDQFECSKQKISDNCGNYDFFKENSDKFNTTIQNLTEIAEYLEEMTPVRFYTDKKSAAEAISRDKESGIYQMTEQLFNFELLPDKNTLFLNLNKILRRYWDDILDFGRTFYIEHNGHFFLSNEKIHYNLTNLTKDMYKIFLQIQNQCETRSMQDTKEFLYFVSNYLLFIEELIENYLEDYSTKTLKHFEKFYETNIKRILIEKKKNIKDRYKELHKKLKPMYGHPKNKRFLEMLQIEAEILNNEMAEIPNDVQAPHIQKLQDEYNKIIDHYNELKMSIPEFEQVMQSLKIISLDLSLKLNEKVNLLRLVVNKETGNTRHTIMNHCKSFLTLFDSTSLPRISSGLECTISTGSPRLRGFHTSLSRTSCSEIDYFLLNMKENYEKFCSEVNAETFEEIVMILKTEWNQAVQKVMELYTVKYK